MSIPMIIYLIVHFSVGGFLVALFLLLSLMDRSHSARPDGLGIVLYSILILFLWPAGFILAALEEMRK